jgi:hypothetical protein
LYCITVNQTNRKFSYFLTFVITLDLSNTTSSTENVLEADDNLDETTTEIAYQQELEVSSVETTTATTTSSTVQHHPHYITFYNPTFKKACICL